MTAVSAGQGAMKKLVKSMTVYGLGGALSRLIQFLLLPLYTRVLLPADYGSLEIVYMVGNVLAILYGLLISSGFVRYYYERDDARYRQELLGSAVWFTFFFSAVFVALSFSFSNEIAGRIFDFSEGAFYFRLITVSTFITAHNQIFYNFLMVREKARWYVTLNIVTLLISLVCAIFFVGFLGWGVKGVLLAQIIGFGIETVLLLLSLAVKNILVISFQRIKDMLKYSLPLIPLQVSSFILELSDRYFLKEYRGLDDVGLYALGYKFAAIVPLLVIQPLKGFTPYIFSLINTPEKCKQTLADFFRYYLAVVLFLALVISVFSREVIMVMADTSYYSSWTVVYALCISYVFYSSIVLVSYAVEIVKKNWITSIFWVCAAGINIFLNSALIPRWGVMGAALATIASYFVILICYFAVVSRIYFVPFRYDRFIFLIGMTSLFYYISTLLHFKPAVSVPVKILLTAGYLLLLVKSRYFTHEEIERLRLFTRTLIRRTGG